MTTAETCSNADAMFHSRKSQFREKNPILPFLVLARNTIMLPHLIIHSLLHYMSTGRLQEVKNKGKCQTFSYKSGRGRLREVVAHKRFQIWWFDLQTFGVLENWSLRRGGQLQQVLTRQLYETTIENDFHFDSNFKNITQWYLESQREIHITVEIRKYHGKNKRMAKTIKRSYEAFLSHYWSFNIWRDWDIQGFKICKLANWWCHTLNQILIKYDEERYLNQFVSQMFDSLQ